MPPNEPRKLKVVLFTRKPLAFGNHSVEILNNIFINRCQNEFDISLVEAKWTSNGILNRIRIIIQAALISCDVLHVTGDINFAGMLVAKKRLITTILDTGQMFSYRNILKRYLGVCFWMRIPIAKSRAIILISHAISTEITGKFKKSFKNFHVVPCPLTIKTRQKHERNDPCNSLLFIGSTPNKNLKRTLEALAGLPVNLSVIGKITSTDHEYAKKLNVKVTNYINIPEKKVIELYRSSKALLFCSTYEGFGLPIVEAMSQNLPVITSNRGSMREVAGDAALLVDPDDCTSIRNAVIRLLNEPDLAEELITKGQENIRRFDQQKIAEQYIALVTQLASSN